MGRGPHRASGIAVTLVLLLPLQLWAAGLGEPSRGRILVATEQLDGPIFAQTVVLLLEHGDEGSLGVIVNRPSSVPVADVLVDPEAMEGRLDTLWEGGPVSLGTMIVLARRGAAAAGLERVCRDVVRVVDDEGLRRVLDEEATELRIYAGFAGWAPGQLDAEIRRGSWHVLDADPAWVFGGNGDGDALWRELEKLANLPLV